MEKYANSGGNSGVMGYEIGADFIRVEFTSGSIYLYTHDSAGRGNIIHMTDLAKNGQGLNSFINTNVRNAYAQKQR